MELQDSRSEIAKLVWAKLAYTECVVSGENTTIIEIKDVWKLIAELEMLLKTTEEALDFNVKQNMELIKANHKLHEERGQNVSEQQSNCNLPHVIPQLPSDAILFADWLTTNYHWEGYNNRWRNRFDLKEETTNSAYVIFKRGN